MSRRLVKPTWLIAGLLTGLLFAILAVPLGATTAPDSRAGRGFGPAYDAVHETILSGTIQEVVTDMNSAVRQECTCWWLARKAQ